MTLRTIPSNDNPKFAALAYGPVVLAGNYGNSGVQKSLPTLSLGSVRRRDKGTSIGFTARTTGTGAGTGGGGKDVSLVPFYNAHGFDYVVLLDC
jgi:uncharacterized protein